MASVSGSGNVWISREEPRVTKLLTPIGRQPRSKPGFVRQPQTRVVEWHRLDLVLVSVVADSHLVLAEDPNVESVGRVAVRAKAGPGRPLSGTWPRPRLPRRVAAVAHGASPPRIRPTSAASSARSKTRTFAERWVRVGRVSYRARKHGRPAPFQRHDRPPPYSRTRSGKGRAAFAAASATGRADSPSDRRGRQRQVDGLPAAARPGHHPARGRAAKCRPGG